MSERKHGEDFPDWITPGIEPCRGKFPVGTVGICGVCWWPCENHTLVPVNYEPPTPERTP